MRIRTFFAVSAYVAIGAACSGSPNPAGLLVGDDGGGGDDGGLINGSGSGRASGSSSSGGGSCMSCSSDSDCQQYCGGAQPGHAWCCSTTNGCYEFTAPACPTSPSGTSTSGTSGGVGSSGGSCTGTSQCGGGMHCCISLTGGFGGGGAGGTCQSSCSSGFEACQKNSDCSSGTCLAFGGMGVCLGGGGSGGPSRSFDAGGGRG